jgi:hypothetical protein
MLIVAATRRRRPRTSTSIRPDSSRGTPSAYPAGTNPIQVGRSATNRRP